MNFVKLKKIKIPFFIIALLLLFEGVIIGIRSYYQEPIGDEVLYEYVWEKNDNTYLWSPEHKLNKKISNLDEIIQTQIIHYKQVNGRTVVHFIEQLFTCHKFEFSIINALIYILLLVLIAKYCFSNKMTCFSLWFISSVSIFYLFPLPERLWISLNLSPNYLWSATLSIGILLIWDSLLNGRVNKYWLFPIAIYSFISGWTHEGFVVGIAGSIFIYYCINPRMINKQALFMIIPYYLSACLMILSPGNFIRLQNGGLGISLSYSLLMGISMYIQNPCILVMVTITVLLLFKRKIRRIRFKLFLSRNQRIIYSIIICFIFSLFANTGNWSITPVILYSFLLFLKIISTNKTLCSRWLNYLTMILVIPLMCHQIMIAKDNILNYKFQRGIIDKYIISPDGIVEYNLPQFSEITKPFVKYWDLNILKITDDELYWNKAYKDGKTPPVFLNSYDIKAIYDPEHFYISTNKFPGTAPVYKAENGIWIWVDPDANMENKKLLGKLKRLDFNNNKVNFLVRLNFILNSSKYPTEIDLNIDTIKTQRGERYRIKLPKIMEIERINWK